MAARRTGRTREDDGSKEEIAECGAARRAEKRHQPGVGQARFRGAGNPQAGRPPIRQQLPPRKSARREGVRGAVRADTRRTWTRVPGRAPSAVTTSFFSQRSRPTRRAGNVSPPLRAPRRSCWKTGAVRRGPAGGAPEPGGDAGTRHALRHTASDADARAVATARSESAVRLHRRSSDPPAGGERAPRNRRLWPQEGECRAAPLREPLLQAPPASADFGVC